MILKSYTLNVTKLLLLQILYPEDGAEKGIQQLNTWLPILDHLLNHAPKLLSSEFLDTVLCQLVPSDRLDGWSLRLWYEEMLDGSPQYLLVLQNLHGSIRLVLGSDDCPSRGIRPADEMFRKEPPAAQSAKEQATKASELRQRLFSDLSAFITNRDAQQVEEAKEEGPMHPQKTWANPAKDRRVQYVPDPAHHYPKVAARGDK